MIIDHEAGQTAVTDFLRLDKAGPVSLVALQPVTGRTHQLRVHMLAAGTPILGDGKYAGSSAHIGGFVRKLHLHARFLSLADGTLLSAPFLNICRPAQNWRAWQTACQMVCPFWFSHITQAVFWKELKLYV